MKQIKNEQNMQKIWKSGTSKLNRPIGVRGYQVEAPFRELQK